MGSQSKDVEDNNVESDYKTGDNHKGGMKKNKNQIKTLTRMFYLRGQPQGTGLPGRPS